MIDPSLKSHAVVTMFWNKDSSTCCSPCLYADKAVFLIKYKYIYILRKSIYPSMLVGYYVVVHVFQGGSNFFKLSTKGYKMWNKFK
jgi:hypothetical protein